MDYTTWEEKQISVNNILLDPRNPRIPPASEPLDQRSLIAELVDHDKVYELAQKIAQNGYYPVESLIVIKEDGKMVVIEGNRRLAALKLLIAPEAAPEDQIPKFRALSNRIPRLKRLKWLLPLIVKQHLLS